MEQQPQEKIKSKIQRLEIAAQGAEAELDEAETLLHGVMAEQIRLESEMRGGANDPELLRKYQTILIDVARLTKERGKFSADLQELREELKALRAHQSEVESVGGLTGQA